MRFCTSARSNPARKEPPEKIGSESCGTKLQAPEPAENKPSRPALAVPPKPVRLRDGKNAARAAPILAFAARS
ncbi:hypothetical protein D3C86_2030520 [compost metagenome]